MRRSSFSKSANATSGLRAGAAEAAALGVWLHGRAGELLEEEMTAYCASPLALIERGLPGAFKELC